jgi:hypothetical protein
MPLPARKFKAFVENATDMALFARMIFDILPTVKDKLEEKGINKEKGRDSQPRFNNKCSVTSLRKPSTEI